MSHPHEPHLIAEGRGPLVTWALRLGLGLVIGVLAGVSSAAFLAALEWATTTFDDRGALLFALPLGGIAIALAYQHHGKGAHAGNNLLLDEIHEPKAWIPRRMAAFTFLASVLTHLLGGSAGREGAAIQLSGSLADGVHRVVRIGGTERRILLLAAIGGGFGAVFGVPVAGVVFALEVQWSVGRLRWVALPSIVLASFVGAVLVPLLGVHHTDYPEIAVGAVSVALVAKVVVAAAAFGVVAQAFARATHHTKRLGARFVPSAWQRAALGGLVVIALTAVVGTRDYLGLSLPLIDASLAGGAGIVAGAFALKLVFTAVTLGTGFQGGEVTPLFVIGSTLGVTLAHLLGAPVPLLAAIGFVAVFGGASNAPLACTIMGVELFGWDPVVLFALGCGVAYACSGSGGIYTSQRQRAWGFHHLRPTDPAAH